MLVIVSAISHALWNYIAKEAHEKETFFLLINITSFFVLFPVFYFFLPEFVFPFEVLPFLIVSAVAEVIYFVGLGKAYENGDLSVVYPLARSSPLFVAMFAVMLLGEKISGWGIVGILLIVLGVYMLHLKSFSMKEILRPFKSLREESSKYALVAAFGTTVYSLSDKIGVTNVSPILYSFWLGIFIPGLMTIPIIRIRGVSTIVREARSSFLKVISAGFLMRGGYLIILVAMSFVEVSYILALRQVSVVLGAILGVIVLKEKYGKVRFLSSLLIFIGVSILGILA
jgi:drug/metabolite transporter (DMT)-like permease